VRSATIYDGAVLAGVRLDRWETMHAHLVLEIGTQVAACGLLDVVRAIRLRRRGLPQFAQQLAESVDVRASLVKIGRVVPLIHSGHSRRRGGDPVHFNDARETQDPTRDRRH
jgi:hypothetical protein